VTSGIDYDAPIVPEPEKPTSIESTWPEDKPFPLTPEECERLVRGDAVPWRGTMREFLSLEGAYEMTSGWIFCRRT
jgi:hypothetical protein